MQTFPRSVIAGLVLAASTAALAEPWVSPGDRRLRDDIELLADTGLITGTTATWPMPWAQIAQRLDSAPATGNNPAVDAALARVKTYSERALDDGLQLTATVRVTNGPALRRDFSDRARDEADITVQAEQTFGSLHLALHAGFRNNDPSNKINFDGSYAAISFGDWAVYGGFLEQWWGSSAEASVIQSNNARPYPKVGITRLVSDPFETRWLRWMGPWRFDASAGKLTGPRSDAFTNPLLIGFRLTFQPGENFEIALSRQLQLCGANRPCSATIVLKSLFPFGFENTLTGVQPGNQTAGYEFRYRRSFGNLNSVIYFNTLAEDTIFQDLSVQLGSTLTGPSTLGTWKIGVEAVDTYSRTFAATNTPGGKVKGFNKRQPGTTYLNFIYLDGISFRGRPLGFSLDGDTYLYTASASLTDLKNRRWHASVNRADINVTNTARYRVSRTRKKLWTAEAGVDWPTRYGDVSVEARYLSALPDLPTAERSRLQGELRWTVGF